MSGALSHFKKDYRIRFCHGGRKKIDIHPGQDVLKVVQDCFESCVSDLTISSPGEAHCSTPIVRKEKKTSVKSSRPDSSMLSQRKSCTKDSLDFPKPKAGSTNSVKRACKSVESSPASSLKPASTRGRSPDSGVKLTTCEDIVVSNTTKSPVAEREVDVLKNIDVVCESPFVSSDSEDDHECFGSPILVLAESSPLHKLHFEDQNSPAAVKSHGKVGSFGKERLEGVQAGRNEQALLRQETEPTAASSVQKEKPFSEVVLPAVTTTLGKRYSASISPPSPPLVKGQDQEIENECEFLIDESFSSWFSLSSKKKQLQRGTSAPSARKSQPPAKEKTEKKKGKAKKAQAEAPAEQKVDDDLAVSVCDFKGTSESAPSPKSEDKVLKSKRQNSAPKGKTTKDEVRQGSPNQKVDLSWRPDSGEMEMAVLGSQTKTSHAKQSKTRVVPSKDSPVPSPEHQQQQTPRKTPKSSKNLRLVSKASQSLASKKKPAQQKLPKDPVAKRLAKTPGKKLKTSAKKSSNKKAQLPREESSDSDPGAEEPERAVTLTEAFTPPQQKTQPGANQKSTQSQKLDSVLQQLGSLGAGNESFVKVLECLMDSMKKSEKKQLPAESAGETPQNVHPRRSEGVCSNHEDVESAGDSDSSSVHGVARKKQKLSAGKRKREKRKHGRQLQDSIVALKGVSSESGPVLEHGDQLPSRSKFSEENHMSSDTSEDISFQSRPLLPDNEASHKIVMPSNTPNVRRTKRVRVKPLEYWRGERINYTVSSSGLVFSGIVCPETKPHRKTEQRRNGHKKKINEASKIPADLDLTLADASKPTIVLDPITNKEVLLKCVSTDMRHDCFFKDEAVEIYKTLNTSAFATGKLILKPLKEKGRQFVHMDTIAFHVIQGRVIFTLHETSYYLTTGSCFYVPAGNEYNIRNILNEESVLFFTQLKVN